MKSCTRDNKAFLGPCDSEQTEVEFVSNQNGGLVDMVSRFAPFQAEMAQGRLSFNGQGQITGPAWERAITSWTQFAHAELASGRVGATTPTVLAWNVGEQEGQCQMLLVLAHGFATAGTTPCQGGQMEVIGGDWVETTDWEQLDEWLYNRAPFYKDNNYLDGRGTTDMSAQESAALAEWVEKVYAELAQKLAIAENFSEVVDTDVPAALNLRQMLAQQLHLNLAAVQITSVEEKMWLDSCFGVANAAETCARVETPGYRIILAVNSEQYVYHTDLEGQQIRLVSLPEPEIGERILTWLGADDSGCRTVEVGTEGVAFGRCGRPLMGVSFSIDTRQADIAEFAAKYASFVAETPVGTVNFVGSGPNVATPAEQRMLAEWAQLVYQEAEFGRSGASWGLVLAWHREGGPSNFCDDVTVYATGDVYVATSCQGSLPVDIGRIRLNATELSRIFEWVDALQPFEYNPDASTEGGETIQMVFSGVGSQTPTELDIGLISEFAQNLQLEASVQAITPPTGCLTPNAEEQLLLNQENGYCLLYPAEYGLAQTNLGAIDVVKDTVMNHIDPRVSIEVESASGRNLQQAAGQIEANYVPSDFAIERSNITVEGMAAIMFDNLPGQDINRRVIFIQNDRLYSLFFSPMGDEGSQVRLQAEALYRQVIDSFRFLETTVPTATPTPVPTPTSAPSGAVVLPSQVQYVMALTDVNIWSGSDTGYPIIGIVFAGQIAQVTGVTADGAWWRVICPDNSVGSCFVIADPSLTQPTTAPGSKSIPPPD